MLSDTMIRRAIDAITLDPMEAIRADHKALKAHYKMANEFANAELTRARKIMAEANLMFDEVDLIRQQIECLERIHPELKA